MIQNNHSPVETYNENRELIEDIDKKSVSIIFVNHLHIDHIGLIPALVKYNKDVRIIIPQYSSAIMKEMLLDSAYIMQRDCETMSLKTNKHYEPFFNVDDVEATMNCVEEYASNQLFTIEEGLEIRYVPSGHIFAAQQLELFFKTGAHVSKVLYTSDLGNTLIEDSKIFVDKFNPVSNANIVIGECTYSDRKRIMKKKDFDKDKEKIHSVIEQFCIDNKARVLIPTFSLDRTEYILWLLYEMFGQDEDFKIPIVIDSPLAIRLIDCYSNVLQGEAKENFNKMMAWNNIQKVVTPEDSKSAVADNKPKVIISASGMLTAGRSVKWTQSILPNPNDCFLFMGYCGVGTLGRTICDGSEKKTININGKPCKNKATLVNLKSFSSHMQRNELINYYKSINCEKVYLVHGDKDTKLDFKEDLEKEISNMSKSTRVIAVNRSTKINL